MCVNICCTVWSYWCGAVSEVQSTHSHY